MNYKVIHVLDSRLKEQIDFEISGLRELILFKFGNLKKHNMPTRLKLIQ